MEQVDDRMVKSDIVAHAMLWLFRAVAVYCLIFGVLYWIRLIGIYPGLNWRFDLMSLHWRIAAPALAVLFPFAAVGLWLTASWGIVVWSLCALTETVMYYWYAELFGWRPAILVIHASVAISYCALFAASWWMNKKQPFA